MKDSSDVNPGAFDCYSDFNVSSEYDEKLAFKINEKIKRCSAEIDLLCCNPA
jgi:hypothetical protein